MGLIKAFSGALSGTLADQWRDIITVDSFNETIAIMPGIRIETNKGRGSNTNASEGVITNGSKIYVPENSLAVIFDSSGIEGIITEPGGFEYRNGEKSIFSHDGFCESIIHAINERFDFGGQPSSYKKILFMNLREIRNVKFGTHGPLLYHDKFYDTDLEIIAHGVLSIQIVKPATFIQNYLPPNCEFYDFSDRNAILQIQSEIAQSLMIALNSMSSSYRTSDLPAHANEICEALKLDDYNVGTWAERYGFELVSFSLMNIQYSPESKKLVGEYSSNKMNVSAYEGSSKEAADIAFQQGIAKGIKEHGLGDAGGVMLGMGMLPNIFNNAQQNNMSIDEQVEAVKKLKELLDIGILSQEEFESKKKEIMKL